MAVVNAAITWLNTDATLVAAFGGGIDQLRGRLAGMSVDAAPYIVVAPSTSQRADAAQRSDGFTVQIQITAVDRAERGLHNLYVAEQRLYGDANLLAVTNGAPTYGLHMKKLTLGADANGWLASTGFCNGGEFDQPSTDELTFTCFFDVHISRVPA